MSPEDERHMDTLGALYLGRNIRLPLGIEVFTHDNIDPINGARHTVVGRKLFAGDVLERGDVYNATSGRWDGCPCPGVTLGGVSDKVTWVRPWWPETVE